MSETPTPSPTEVPNPTPTPEATPTETPSPIPSSSPLGEAPAKEEKPPLEGEAAPEEKPTEEEKPAEPTKFEFTLPEGVELLPEAMEPFQNILNQLKATPEQAQELVNFHVEALKKQSESLSTQIEKNWQETLSTWAQARTSDPEIGGDKSVAVQAVLGVALDEYGTPEARQAFDATGAGWNPHIIKFVYNMAKSLAEGAPTALGRPSAKTLRTPGEALYGTPDPQN